MPVVVSVDVGGTGANSAAGARASLGVAAANDVVLKTGDTMTGQLNVSSGGLIVQSNDSERAAFIRSPTRTLRITPYYNSEGNDKGTWLEAINTSNAAYNKFTLSGSNIILEPTANVGIGTTSPDGKLDIATGGSSDVVAALGGTFPAFTYRNGSGAWFHAGKHPSSDYYYIGSGATPTSTINIVVNSSGNVGIGTTDPSANLHVAGTIKDTPIVSITGSATYADNAAGRVIFSDTSSAVTVTIAPAATAGFSYTIIRGNTGNVTIANSGVTRLNSASITSMNVSQYGAATVVYTATNQVIVFGDFV